MRGKPLPWVRVTLMILFAASDARILRSDILLVVVSVGVDRCASTTIAVSLEMLGQTPNIFAMFESSGGVGIIVPGFVTVDDF